MGMSFFNRMRRERKPVEMIEAERSEQNLKFLHGRSIDRQRVHAENKERVEEIREAEVEASERIRVKALIGQGIDPDTGEQREKMEDVEGLGARTAFTIDEPLRKDHAAEIAGRNLQGVQEIKSPMQRLDERIPSGETAAEALVPHLSVERDGPTAEMVEAARLEREDPAYAPGGTAPDRNADGKSDESDLESTVEARAGVIIPENWTSLPAAERKELASRLAGYDITRTADGDPIVRDELARREAWAVDRQKRAEADRDNVEIADDWATMVAEDRKALATELTGVDYATVAEADPVIKAEMARRAEAADAEDDDETQQ